jgi:hypothetical protein
MARVGTTKRAATAAMLLLLAMVVAASAALDHQQKLANDCGRNALNGGGNDRLAGTLGRHGGHHRGRDEDQDPDQSPLTKLTVCATHCGSDVTTCMINCFQPLSAGKGSPVTTPLCLLACTTQVMSCATKCPADIV